MRASRESSRRSLGTDDSLDSSVGSEPERSLSQRSTMLYLPAKFTVPPPTLPFGLNSLSCAAALNTRNNSVNSIQSSSNSSTLSSTDKVTENDSIENCISDFPRVCLPFPAKCEIIKNETGSSLPDKQRHERSNRPCNRVPVAIFNARNRFLYLANAWEFTRRVWRNRNATRRRTFQPRCGLVHDIWLHPFATRKANRVKEVRLNYYFET